MATYLLFFVQNRGCVLPVQGWRLQTVLQLEYARTAIGVRSYRNWSTLVSQLPYGL